MNTVGLDEAKVRKYILAQEEGVSIEDKYDSDLNNPLRDTCNNALVGLIKPPLAGGTAPKRYSARALIRMGDTISSTR